VEGAATGVEAAVGVLDTAGVQAIAEEATALQGALQGVVACHLLVDAALAGHQFVDVMILLPMEMGIAAAGARAVPDV
jgi:hypothetical protein